MVRVNNLRALANSTAESDVLINSLSEDKISNNIIITVISVLKYLSWKDFRLLPVLFLSIANIECIDNIQSFLSDDVLLPEFVLLYPAQLQPILHEIPVVVERI